LQKSKKKTEIYNIGSEDVTDVLTLAKIVCKGMNLNEVKLEPTGGIDNGRGWIGDVKQMHLDISKLKKIGWMPKLSSDSAIKQATLELLKEIN